MRVRALWPATEVAPGVLQIPAFKSSGSPDLESEARKTKLESRPSHIQLQTQITDLEMFIDFLQGEASTIIPGECDGCG